MNILRRALRGLGCGTFAGIVAVSILFLTVGAAHAESRPFRASMQGHANPLPTADPCVLTNSEAGTGHARHLGAITWISNEVVNLCADGGPQVRAEFILTAANGDQVFGHLRTVARFDFVASQITFAGLWEIDGGTGHFQDAQGQGQLSGWGSLLPPFDVTAEFSGEIRY
jgi:hypothetical protein